MKLGLFVDLSNLYHGTKKVHGRKVNYEAYYNWIQNALGQVQIARAYGTQIKNKAKEFQVALKKSGFTPIYKQTRIIETPNRVIRKGDVDTKMVVDILVNLDLFDTLILGSADSDFVPVVEHCLKVGKRVILLASNISNDYHKLDVTCLEIHRGLLE